MAFRTVTIKVDGKEVTIDTRVKLGIHDINKGMDRVASDMAYWGAVWAAAEKESIEVEAVYRKWRAEQGQKALAKEPKMAEWKVKQAIEATTAFVKFKTAQALAKRNATLAKSMFESFKTKGSMLQSKGAMSRAELDATNMRTPKSPRKSDKESSAAQANMRSINKKRKARKD